MRFGGCWVKADQSITPQHSSKFFKHSHTNNWVPTCSVGTYQQSHWEQFGVNYLAEGHIDRWTSQDSNRQPSNWSSPEPQPPPGLYHRKPLAPCHGVLQLTVKHHLLSSNPLSCNYLSVSQLHDLLI